METKAESVCQWKSQESEKGNRSLCADMAICATYLDSVAKNQKYFVRYNGALFSVMPSIYF